MNRKFVVRVAYKFECVQYIHKRYNYYATWLASLHKIIFICRVLLEMHKRTTAKL